MINFKTQKGSLKKKDPWTFSPLGGGGQKQKNAWFLRLKSIFGHTESFILVKKNLVEKSGGVPILCHFLATLYLENLYK